MKPKTEKTTLKRSDIIKRLSDAGVDAPAFDASVLIEHFEKKTKAYQIAFPETEYEGEELAFAVSRREKREPLQYIIGEWEFMGYSFYVSRDTLVPRADTELICQNAIDRLRDKENARLCDLCTGTGCIAVSALLECENASGVAVELMPATLEMAKKNVERHCLGGRLELICADVTEDIALGQFDVIVSNPPYVTIEEMKDISPEVETEPRVALTDEGDGLSVIRKILEIYPSHLKKNGVLLIEFGWKQGKAVLEIAEGLGLNAEIIRDIEGRDRVISVKK